MCDCILGLVKYIYYFTTHKQKIMSNYRDRRVSILIFQLLQEIIKQKFLNLIFLKNNIYLKL